MEKFLLTVTTAMLLCANMVGFDSAQVLIDGVKYQWYNDVPTYTTHKGIVIQNDAPWRKDENLTKAQDICNAAKTFTPHHESVTRFGLNTNYDIVGFAVNQVGSDGKEVTFCGSDSPLIPCKYWTGKELATCIKELPQIQQ